jgi:hypothetical protein
MMKSKNKILSFPALPAFCVLMLLGSASAQEIPVDLELALGADVSGSVDEEEADLQRGGYIAAFRHPSIIDAIRNGPYGRIAVAYYEWAGFDHMRVIADWTLIKDRQTALAFADALTRNPPQTARRTAISAALEFGSTWFDKNDYTGRRRVVDISGDGPNNWGEPVTAARARAIARGVIINGLPIMNDRPSLFGRAPMKNLDLYYRNCVIGGPGAFLITARNFKDFPRAIMRKLILEIADLRPPTASPLLRRVALQQKAPPCNIGERMRQWRLENDETRLRLPGPPQAGN